jgi:hypothetical protein
VPAPTIEILAAFREFLAQFQEETVQDFAAGIDWSMPQRALQPNTLSCLKHLDRAAEIAPREAALLAQLLSGSRMSLHWGQTYSAEDFGPEFLDNYGWVETFGTRGHFANTRVAGGFLLLGPQTAYPDHHHIAEEIYIPLTGGALWRMGNAPLSPRAAGEVIHHRSNVVHAMETLSEPLLALYLWRGGPLAQRSDVIGAA